MRKGSIVLGQTHTSLVEFNQFNFKKDYQNQKESQASAVFIPIENKKRMVVFSDTETEVPKNHPVMECFGNYEEIP